MLGLCPAAGTTCIVPFAGRGFRSFQGANAPVILMIATGFAARAMKDIFSPGLERPNKRGAGKGRIAVLWRAGGAGPALPDRERSA